MFNGRRGRCRRGDDNIKAHALTATTRLGSAPDIATVDDAGCPVLDFRLLRHAATKARRSRS